MHDILPWTGEGLPRDGSSSAEGVPSSVWLRRASRRKELLSHARAPRGYVVRCWLEHRGVPLHRPPGAQEEAPPLQACVVNLPTAKAVELDWARATLPVELACARPRGLLLPPRLGTRPGHETT
jgi:hypothetical protein